MTAMAGTAFASDLEIHGSNTVGEKLAPALIAGFLEHRNADSIRLEATKTENERNVVGTVNGKAFTGRVAAHGTGTGFAGLQSGKADLAAASRAAKPKEIELLRSQTDLRDRASEHIVAIDGLAILVHPSNPIDALDKATLAQIFAGEITHWKELGGPDLAITLYARDDRSGTWDTFKSLVLSKEYPLSGQARRYESNDQLSDDVSRDPGAIGFTGLASVRSSKLLAIADGDSAALLPTQLNVATEDYPLSRRLYLYSRGAADSELTRQFLAFSQGPQGQNIVQQTGYVSQNIQAVSGGRDSQVPESFKRLTERFERLTVNFRFSEGRTKLDNKAYRDLERLAFFVKDQGADVNDILLIGFADRHADELRAQMISELRALSVKKALRENQGLEIKSYTGYGQYMPVGDNDDGKTARRNGRVEVWIRKRDPENRLTAGN